MKLKKLQLENFRNYQKNLYEFPENKELIILTGPNGTGKTNFLEAIHLLSLGKSFRSLTQDDMVHWENDYLRCTADVEVDNENLNLEVFYSLTPVRKKNFKKNGVNLKNSEYLGNLLTVLFHPEDLNMLYQSPSLRRRYLDIVLSQTDKNYLIALSKYKRALKQRNVLLNQLRDAHYGDSDTGKLEEDLLAWDDEIIEFGSVVILKRLGLVAFLNEKVEKIYRSISGDKEKISVEYSSRILKDRAKLGTNQKSPAPAGHLLESISEMYKGELFNRKKRDIFSAETTAGPHRDDLIFYLNGKNICSSASRGEFRTLLLALKLAEIEFIKECTGHRPILLLDDVFSELDRKRQKHLLKCIKGCQTIITTTSPLDDKEMAGSSVLVEIDKVRQM